MYAAKIILSLTTLVVCAIATAIDSNSLFGLNDGVAIAGVVVRDVNGVEHVVDYKQAAHLIPRQDFCKTETIYSCGSPPPASTTAVVPVNTPTPGAPADTPSAPSGTEAAPAPPAATSAPAPGAPSSGGAAPSAPAASTTIAGTTTGTTASPTESGAVSTEAGQSTATSGAATSAATTSALPENNSGAIVDANMAAALVVGFAVAAFV